ncbi:unnamed protein product [Euphydryas editha]|uniref:MADF domain-containing protein n=1 Tax=Euphydryas editha TaxID=104508 RepID=A0AAU9TZX0_EUPED|nr:unnamed protein product [Euphydryas editha]
MASFTNENDEFLVDLITRNPPLYDCRLKTYKDNNVRDNIWEYIASKLNKTSDDCRKRWKCIRDSYQRIKRKNKLKTGSAAGGKFKKWPLLDRLCFLEKIPTERRTLCNIDSIETTNDSNSNDSENVSNDDVNCSNKENYVETNSTEMNNEGSSGTVMVGTPTYETDVIERTDDEEPNKKAKRSIGCVLKKGSKAKIVQCRLLYCITGKRGTLRGELKFRPSHFSQLQTKSRNQMMMASNRFARTWEQC